MAKAKKEKQETIDIPHEVIGETAIATAAPQSTGVWNPEESIKAFKAKEKTITEYKTKYAGVVIADLNDRDNIKLAREAKKVLRSERTGIEAERVAIKSPALKFGQTVDAAAKQLTEMIVETESVIDTELDKLKKWEDAEEIRLKEESEKEINRRISLVKESGAIFDGFFYCIEQISIDKSSIQAMPLDRFEKTIEDIQAAKIRVDKRDALVLAELKKERLTSRGNMLLSIGMETKNDGDAYFSELLQGITVLRECLTDEPDDKFITLFSSLSTRINDAKNKAKDEAEKKAKERTVAVRSKLIVAAGLYLVDFMPGTVQRGFYFKNMFVECRFPIQLVESQTDEEFDATLAVFEQQIAEAKISELKKEEEDKAAAVLAEEQIKINAAKELEAKKERELQAEKERKDREAKEEAAKTMYMERQYQLINLGLVVETNKFNTRFWFRDEFALHGIVTVDEVKAIDPDAWSSKLTLITDTVNQVKAHSEVKRNEARLKAESLKPEVTKANEYLLSILDLKMPEIKDASLSEIMVQFHLQQGEAISRANKAIAELNK